MLTKNQIIMALLKAIKSYGNTYHPEEVAGCINGLAFVLGHSQHPENEPRADFHIRMEETYKWWGKQIKDL